MIQSKPPLSNYSRTASAFPTRHEPHSLSIVVRQPAPLEQNPKEVNLHILLPQHLARPFSPLLRDPLSLLDMRRHLEPSPPRQGTIHAGKIGERAPDRVQAYILGDEVMPSRHALVVPFAEQGAFEGQTVGLEEGEETAGEAGTVEVEEVAVLPVGLEVCRAHEAEFCFLVFAVVQADAAAAGDVVNYGDVGGETKVSDGVPSYIDISISPSLPRIMRQ